MAHFHHDYNSETKPSFLIERWKERVQKDGFSSRLFPFGWGDGGGGPTREHLEYALRQKNLEGVPKFRIENPMTFFLEQEQAGWPSERYVGELYFQAHRGTYTSQARTKLLNRQSEIALREAELWGAAAMVMGKIEFPFAEWDSAWKKLLLNQFHDILPGSSIQRVYEEAEAQLSEVIQTSSAVADAGRSALVQGDKGLTVFNGLSWERTELIELPPGMTGLQSGMGQNLPAQTDNGKTFIEASVPSCGWASYSAGGPESPENALIVSENRLENDLVKIVFNDFGEIIQIYDKDNLCELNTGPCNSLRMYQDIPSAFDAWDIDSMYRQTPVELPERAEITVGAEGPLFASLNVKRRLNNSVITQTIRLRRNSRRVDFETIVDWQERHKLLKVNFPVDFYAKQALHEIQFGHLPRPTHRSNELDQDRFEVVNHRWTALVEANRGFAILNDSKYGVDVLDNSINLTLLKSALAPDMFADCGEQVFTYSFYFWDTPFMDCDLVQQGYQLNVPLQICEGSGGVGSLFALDTPNIILETIKPAEDRAEDNLVLRFYECMGTKTSVRLTTSLPVSQVYQTNMLEQAIEKLDLLDNHIQLNFRPFEIKTLRLVIDDLSKDR